MTNSKPFEQIHMRYFHSFPDLSPSDYRLFTHFEGTAETVKNSEIEKVKIQIIHLIFSVLYDVFLSYIVN